MPLDEAARKEIHAEVRARQQRVVRDIERILNGQDVKLPDIPLPQEDDPREPPLERLRRFMRVLDALAPKVLEPGFGLCRACGAEIPPAELREVPWADRCKKCAG